MVRNKTPHLDNFAAAPVLPKSKKTVYVLIAIPGSTPPFVVGVYSSHPKAEAAYDKSRARVLVHHEIWEHTIDKDILT